MHWNLILQTLFFYLWKFMSMTWYLPLAHSQNVQKSDINRKNRKSFLLLRLIYSGSVVLIQFTLLIISRLKLNNFSTFWNIKIWIRLLLSGEYTSLLCNLDFKMHRFFLLLYIKLMNLYPLVLNPRSMLYGYFYRYRLMSIHVDENPQPENIAHKFFTLINWSLIPTTI